MIALLALLAPARADDTAAWVSVYADLNHTWNQKKEVTWRPGLGVRLVTDLGMVYTDTTWLDGFISEWTIALAFPGDETPYLGAVVLNGSGGVWFGDDNFKGGGGIWLTDQWVRSTFIGTGWNWAAGLEGTAWLGEHAKIDVGYAWTYAYIAFYEAPHYSLDMPKGVPKPGFARMRATAFLADEPGEGGFYVSVQYTGMLSIFKHEHVNKFETQIGMAF